MASVWSSMVMTILLCLSFTCSATAFTTRSCFCMGGATRRPTPSLLSNPFAPIDEATEGVKAIPRNEESEALEESTALPGAASAAGALPVGALGSISFGGGNAEYQRGLVTIAAITLLFSSNSPALHAAFSSDNAPPVLLVNASISLVALVGLIFGGATLESSTPLPSALREDANVATKAGLELGLWKFLGTTANLAGLSLTTADHGAFLIQLTTLIVPVVQGIMGVPIPRRIQAAVLLALSGVFVFAQDGSGSAAAGASVAGDALCAVAAGFYAAYDLRLFHWGRLVAPRELVTGKIATQAVLSAGLLAACGSQAAWDYAQSSPPPRLDILIPVILWSGVAVNAIAPYLQVGGQQAVGPTRCQTIYASQPLWASIMSFVFLGETVGAQGLIGGTAFLIALFLAATAEAPDPNCGEANCEV